MSVAILAQPPPDDQSRKVNMKEFKIENFRACAPGGQNVNKSETGVRITHLPSGKSDVLHVNSIELGI